MVNKYASVIPQPHGTSLQTPCVPACVCVCARESDYALCWHNCAKTSNNCSRLQLAAAHSFHSVCHALLASRMIKLLRSILPSISWMEKLIIAQAYLILLCTFTRIRWKTTTILIESYANNWIHSYIPLMSPRVNCEPDQSNGMLLTLPGKPTVFDRFLKIQLRVSKKQSNLLTFHLIRWTLTYIWVFWV